MPTHLELLNDMSGVRAAVINRYPWLVHVTPAGNLPNIRANGLRPRFDAAPPQEVVTLLGVAGGNIICLHPLGAALCPRGTKQPPLISLAVRGEDIPARIGLDWSYSWEIVQGRMELHRAMPTTESVQRIAHDLGSIGSCDVIPSNNLRVFGKTSMPRTHKVGRF